MRGWYISAILIAHAAKMLRSVPMQHKRRNGHGRFDPMRRKLASLAAEMMARDGITDYGFAKRKAARQLGVPATEALPDNAEIETALRAYQSLYQAGEHGRRIDELRRIALDLMLRLEAFSPYLVGHVLEGTAGRFAGIDLNLYADTAKNVEIFLLSHGIPYEPAGRRQRHGEMPETEIELEWNDVPVRLAIFRAVDERVRFRRGNAGQPRPRADVRALRALLADGTP